MSDIPQDDKSDVDQYRQLVLEYEQLDEQIDTLIMRNHGGTEEMSKEDYALYRQLASRRDDLYNQIKELESRLFDDT